MPSKDDLTPKTGYNSVGKKDKIGLIKDIQFKLLNYDNNGIALSRKTYTFSNRVNHYSSSKDLRNEKGGKAKSPVKTNSLCVRGFVIKGIFYNDNDDKYYAKPNEDMIARIDKITKGEDKLIITTIGNPVAYCLKTTKSIPQNNSLCWNKIENNKVEVSYFKYKKYYVWIKDNEGRISERVVIG